MMFRQSQYLGLISNRNHRKKYDGCERIRIGGGEVRKLSDVEIEKFRAHIMRLLNPLLGKGA